MIWVHETCRDIAGYNLFSDEMTIDLNVLGPLMENWIRGDV